MKKETEKKHEGFATITGREKFFFERSVWQQKKGEQIEKKETRNISIRMRTIKMEV